MYPNTLGFSGDPLDDSAIYCINGAHAAERAKQGFDMVRLVSFVPEHP